MLIKTLLETFEVFFQERKLTLEGTARGCQTCDCYERNCVIGRQMEDIRALSWPVRLS